jgi:hypothetical protein
MQTVLLSAPKTNIILGGGARRILRLDAGTCEAVFFNMVAEDYPLKDIKRMTALLERLVEEAPKNSHWVFRYSVKPDKVCMELNGASVERIVLLRDSQLAWMHFGRRKDSLTLLSYRLIH